MSDETHAEVAAARRAFRDKHSQTYLQSGGADGVMLKPLEPIGIFTTWLTAASALGLTKKRRESF